MDSVIVYFDDPMLTPAQVFPDHRFLDGYPFHVGVCPLLKLIKAFALHLEECVCSASKYPSSLLC
jgi:hypothetical protein